MPANVGSLMIDIAANTARLQSDMGKAHRIMQRNSRMMQQTMQAAGVAIGAVFSARTLAAVADMSDAYKQVQNRLKLVTGSTAELSDVQERLFSLSQASRTQFESTADLYARLARATDGLNASSEDTLKVTEAISKAFVVSGASAQEASAAVVQLGQGLASGALRGDELRSVLEQAPRLAKAIADGLGVSIGELRQLGTEGKLTAEAVFGALLGQAERINAEFKQLDPTIGQAFGNLSNSLVNVVGKIDDAMGASSGLADAVITLSEKMDKNAQYFADAARGAKEYATALTDAVTAVLEFADLSPSDVFESVIKTNPNLAYSLAILDALVAKGAEARAEAEKPWIVRGQANMEPISAPKPNDGDDSAAKKIASDQLKVQEWLSSERISLIQDEYAQRIAEIEREADRQREAAHGSVALLDQIGQIEAQKIAEVEADKLKARQEAQNEYRRLLMTENQREVADLQERHEEELRIAEEYGLDLHVLRVKQEMELTDLLAKQEDERLRNSRDALDGMTVAFRDYADEATNLAHQTGEVITSVMGGLEDQLVNFVQTGKMQFEDLANSIISDLLRIAIRANITGPIASMLGGLDFFNAHGNVYGESGVMAFAHGGAFTNSIVTKPTLFPFAKGTGLMGEAGPEAIMPLTRTSGGDLGVRAEGFGGAGVVVNIINNANGTEVSTRESTGANGGKTIEVLIDEINGKNAARHGSATDRAMRGAYGVKPALVRR